MPIVVILIVEMVHYRHPSYCYTSSVSFFFNLAFLCKIIDTNLL